MKLLLKIKHLFFFLYCLRNNVNYKTARMISSYGGNPLFDIKGRLSISDNIYMVNNACQSTLGNPRRCKFTVYNDAELRFNGRCGMSNAVIVATKSVIVGKNVMIGGGTTIIDSDFHSLDYNDWFTPSDENKMKSKGIYIGNNVFIGMDCLIMKGVHIGDGAIVAARSIVTKDIPSNEVWGGNPAKFLKVRA